MADQSPVVANVEDGQDVNGPEGLDGEMVEAISERMQQQLTDPKQFVAMKALMQQAPDLTKAIAAFCPEFIAAFVFVDQKASQGGGQQPGGSVPPGMAAGAMPPPSQPAPPPGSSPDQGGAMQIPGNSGGGPSGPLPPPAATTTGNPPPSVPGPETPLRRQFFTGR